MIGVEVLRSPVKWLGVVVAALLTYVAIVGLRPGLLLWSDVNVSFTQAGSLINPLVAGVAAWESGRRYNGGFGRRLDRGARAPWTAVSSHFTAIVLWLAIPAALTLLGFVVVMAVIGGYGHAELPWLAASSSGTLLSAALGYLVGARTAGKWWGAPLAAIGLYLGYVLIGAAHKVLPYWVDQVYPIVLNGSNPFVRYVLPTILGQMIWYLAVAGALLCLVPGVIRRRMVLVGALVSLLVVGGSGLVMLHSTNGQLTSGYNSRDYVCDTTPVRICVNRAYRQGLPQLETVFAAYNTKVAGTPVVAKKLEHQVEGVGDEPARGAQSLYVEDLSAGFATNSLLFYDQKYLGLDRCQTAEAANLHSIVDSWLLGQASSLVTSPDSPEGAAAVRFAAYSEPERTAWFKADYRDVLSCQLTPAQFA